MSLLIKRGNPPLYGISDIKYELKRVEMGGVLTPGALLRISDSLRVSRGLKKYMKDNEADKGSRYPIVEGLISNLMIFTSSSLKSEKLIPIIK